MSGAVRTAVLNDLRVGNFAVVVIRVLLGRQTLQSSSDGWLPDNLNLRLPMKLYWCYLDGTHAFTPGGS